MPDSFFEINRENYMDEQEKSKSNYFSFYIFALIEAIFRGRKNELEKTN